MGHCLELFEKFCPRPSLLLLDPALNRASPCLMGKCIFLALFDTWFFPPPVTFFHRGIFAFKKQRLIHIAWRKCGARWSLQRFTWREPTRSKGSEVLGAAALSAPSKAACPVSVSLSLSTCLLCDHSSAPLHLPSTGPSWPFFQPHDVSSTCLWPGL